MMENAISWSESESQRADFEGWLLVITDNGACIQRRDYEPLFSSDAQALLFVEKKARQGSAFHIAALGLVLESRLSQSPAQVFEQMKASGRFETFGKGATCFARLHGRNIDYCLSANSRELLYSRASSDPTAPWLSQDHDWKPLTPKELKALSI